MKTCIYDTCLCCLDLSDTDKNILNFTSFLKDNKIIGKITFIHVVNSDLEEMARKYYAESAWEKIKVDLKNEIDSKIDAYFEDKSEINIKIKTGSPLEIIKNDQKKVKSLTIVGRKAKGKGSGVISDHIARASKNDVLFIPTNWNLEFDTALTAFDFSEHAESTFDLVNDISKQLNSLKLKAIHIISSPSNYFKSGHFHKSYIDTEKEEINSKWKSYIKRIKTEAELRLYENKLNDPAYYISELSSELINPIVFIGSKGKTAASTFLLGSVTEKLMAYDLNIPIWIHKLSDENFDLLDAIFSNSK